MLKDKLQSSAVHHVDGLLFLSSKKGPLKAVEFEQYAISAKLYGKRKNDLVEVAGSFRLEPAGTIATIKKRKEHHLQEVERKYHERKIPAEDIAFLDREVQPFLSSMACLDSTLIYSADAVQKAVYSLTLKKNGI